MPTLTRRPSSRHLPHTLPRFGPGTHRGWVPHTLPHVASAPTSLSTDWSPRCLCGSAGTFGQCDSTPVSLDTLSYSLHACLACCFFPGGLTHLASGRQAFAHLHSEAVTSTPQYNSIYHHPNQCSFVCRAPCQPSTPGPHGVCSVTCSFRPAGQARCLQPAKLEQSFQRHARVHQTL